MTPSVCSFVLAAVPWGGYGDTIPHKFPLGGLGRVFLERGLWQHGQKACRTRREPQHCCILDFLMLSLYLILSFLWAAEDGEVVPLKEMDLCVLELWCHL